MKATISLSNYYQLTSSDQRRQYYNDLLQVLDIRTRASVHSIPKYDFNSSDINDTQIRILTHLAYAKFAEDRSATAEQLFSDLLQAYPNMRQEKFEACLDDLVERRLLKIQNSKVMLILTKNECTLPIIERLYKSCHSVYPKAQTQAPVISNSNSNAPEYNQQEPSFASSPSSSQIPSLQQGTSPVTFSTRGPSMDSANTANTNVSLNSKGRAARQKNKNPPSSSAFPAPAQASKGNKKAKTAPASSQMPNHNPSQNTPNLDTNFIMQELAKFKQMAQVNQQRLNDMAQENQRILNVMAQENQQRLDEMITENQRRLDEIIKESQRRSDEMIIENQKRLDAMEKEMKGMTQQITTFSAPQPSNLNVILPFSPPLTPSLSNIDLPPALSLNASLDDDYLNIPMLPTPPFSPQI